MPDCRPHLQPPPRPPRNRRQDLRRRRRAAKRRGDPPPPPGAQAQEAPAPSEKRPLGPGPHLPAPEEASCPGDPRPRHPGGALPRGALLEVRPYLLGALVTTARSYGLPRALRTDNEPGLCSVLFRTAVRLLGVRHQRTLPHCPWQNGRVERFFATFKERMLRRLADLREQGAEPLELGQELALFRTWYNHARPHQNLEGRTPAEAWDGISEEDLFRRRRFRLVNEWEGLLVGCVPR